MLMNNVLVTEDSSTCRVTSWKTGSEPLRNSFGLPENSQSPMVMGEQKLEFATSARATCQVGTLAVDGRD